MCRIFRVHVLCIVCMIDVRIFVVCTALRVGCMTAPYAPYPMASNAYLFWLSSRCVGASYMSPRGNSSSYNLLCYHRTLRWLKLTIFINVAVAAGL